MLQGKLPRAKKLALTLLRVIDPDFRRSLPEPEPRVMWSGCPQCGGRSIGWHRYDTVDGGWFCSSCHG